MSVCVMDEKLWRNSLPSLPVSLPWLRHSTQ